MTGAARLAIALGLAVMTQAASAAERAELGLIGFSPDGRYFAFEEYGIQDGSGFAYASVQIVDMIADAWAAGPFRFRADDETTPLAEVRNAVGTEAASALEGFGVSVPGVLIASNGDGETGGDGLDLGFGVPGYSSPGSIFGDYRLSLETFDAPSPDDCVVYLGEEPKGFALLLEADGTTEVIHRDESIPRSRGCPTAYRIYGVVLPFSAFEPTHAVVLISVYAFGFEGVDRRFLALPLLPPGI